MNILERMPWAAQNAVFEKLGELAEVAHLGTEERDRYERSLKHYRDTIDVFETAKEDGYAEGRADAILETARNLKAAGVDISIIATATGLAPDEIAKI